MYIESSVRGLDIHQDHSLNLAEGAVKLHSNRCKMQFTVFAIRFQDGAWKEFKHHCSPAEDEAILESARAKAFEQFRYLTPQYADYLAAASYIFNIARGANSTPANGDTVVFGVQVGDKVIRKAKDIRHMLAR